MKSEQGIERVEAVVIGAGQAGLAVGYHLARWGRPFVILEANARVGDSWRRRWDSLRLFTPARFDGIVGSPFPASSHAFPTKDEMANYLEDYAARFKLPIRTGVKVDRVSRHGRRYLVSTADRQYDAEHVVVAMANFQVPRVPPFAKELDPQVVQLHSSEYRNPGQLRAGDVLIVGAGNSGAEIAAEVARSHGVWMSGRDTGHIPFRVDSLVGRLQLPFLFRVVFHRILTVDTPMGRKVRAKVLTAGGALIRVKPKDLAAAGVTRVPRMAGVVGGRPMLEGGQVIDVTNIVWCTGFEPGFSWIDLPVFESNGQPKHHKGVATGEPGLYFVGLHFLYAFSSTMIHGVSRDAERIVGEIDARSRAAESVRTVSSESSGEVRSIVTPNV
jgi:putative flavoprotein involved in K+ transport